MDKKLVEKKQTYLWRKLKSKQTLMNGLRQPTIMNTGHILAILIGFYASFAVTVMTVSPMLG